MSRLVWFGRGFAPFLPEYQERKDKNLRPGEVHKAEYEPLRFFEGAAGAVRESRKSGCCRAAVSPHHAETWMRMRTVKSRAVVSSDGTAAVKEIFAGIGDSYEPAKNKSGRENYDNDKNHR